MTRIMVRLLQLRLAFLALIAVVSAAAMSQLSPYFLDVDNLLGMTKFGAVLGLVALGQTLVIISGRGGVDLSVGSMLSLSGVFFGTLSVGLGIPIPLAAAATLLFGLMLGALNGVLVAVVGIQPIIATIGTLYIYASLALVWTGGVPISGFAADFGFLGQGTTLGVSNQVILVLAPVALLLGYVITSTVFGRSIFLVGINDTAAALSGVNVGGTRLAVYALSGLLAAIGAIVTASWLLTARPDAGQGYELRSITVVVLGGTAIMGGEGGLAGTLLAVLVVTIIASGLQLANVTAILQLAVLGGLLLSAALLNQLLAGQRRKGTGVGTSPRPGSEAGQSGTPVGEVSA